MPKITMNIEAETPEELKDALSKLGTFYMTSGNLALVEPVTTPALVQEPSKTQRKPAAKSVAKPEAATPEPAEPVEQAEENTEAVEPISTEQPEDDKMYTLDEVKTFLKKLSADGKQKAVKALINQYAEALSDVPAEKYGELMAAAKAI